MKPAEGCLAEFDPKALSVEEARARIDEALRPVTLTERLSLRAALDRVIAADLHSLIAVPPYRNSAMDGYAIRAADTAGDAQVVLELRGQALAGHPFAGTLAAGECVRITTGAPLPEGADSVVVQELVETTEGTGVRVPPGIEQGANVREAGEDLRPGDRLLPAGTRLNAAAIASLASVGMSELDVFRRPRVAFFSTGDELRGLGQPLEPGQIYDSNRYALHALLSRCGVSILDLGVVADDPVAVRAAFEQGAREADVLITTGGVSVGSADYVTETLRSLGEVGFWKIAMKPGRPLAFGRLGECLFFGLPGNPVSTVVTFLIFVRGALLRMGGEHEPSLPRLSAIASQPLRKRAGRVDYQRGRYAIDPQGLLRVESAGGQGSHLLGALARSNCLIVLPREATEVEAGAAVEIIPLQGLL